MYFDCQTKDYEEKSATPSEKYETNKKLTFKAWKMRK